MALCSGASACGSDGSLQPKNDDFVPQTFDGVCSSWFPVDAPHQLLVYEREGWSGWDTLTVESGINGIFGGELMFVLGQTVDEASGDSSHTDYFYQCDQGNVYYIGRASEPDTQCPGEPLPTGVEVCDAPILEWSDSGFETGSWVGRANCTWTVSFYNSDCANREEYEAEPWNQVVERQWTVVGPEAVDTELGMVEAMAVDLYMPFYNSTGAQSGSAAFWLAKDIGVVWMETPNFYDRGWLSIFHQLLVDVIPEED